MDYYYKYRKYKLKYLNAQKNECVDMIGGAPPSNYFRNGQKLFIIAKLDDTDTNKSFRERTDILLNGHSPFRKPHVSLLDISINMDNRDSYIFDSDKFADVVCDAFKQYLSNITLHSPHRQYLMFGQSGNQFFGRAYDVEPSTDLKNISAFRMEIYNYINKAIGATPTSKVSNHNNLNFYEYSYHGTPLYAVSEHYHGRQVWTPHISVINEKDLQTHNNPLYQRFRQQLTDDQKKDIIWSQFIGKPLTPMSYINFKDIKTIEISHTSAGAKLRNAQTCMDIPVSASATAPAPSASAAAAPSASASASAPSTAQLPQYKWFMHNIKYWTGTQSVDINNERTIDRLLTSNNIRNYKIWQNRSGQFQAGFNDNHNWTSDNRTVNKWHNVSFLLK